MIEFLEEPHIYLKDGILVSSVTQILQLIFPDKYKNVNQAILNKKAEFGSLGHSIIENLDVSDVGNAKKEIEKMYKDKAIDQDMYICLREYLRLVEKYNIEPMEQEQRVSYEYYYCGTLDMIGSVGGDYCLLDVKFTAELDEEYLSWQLSMYELAKGFLFDKLYCIWLPKKGLAQLKEIKRKSVEEIIAKLKEVGVINETT